MTAPKYGNRDTNHAAILDTARGIGARVWDTSAIGGGFPDALVYWAGQVYLVEIKNPDTRYGRSGPTARQRRFASDGWPVLVVRTADELLVAIGAL